MAAQLSSAEPSSCLTLPHALSRLARISSLASPIFLSCLPPSGDLLEDRQKKQSGKGHGIPFLVGHLSRAIPEAIWSIPAKKSTPAWRRLLGEFGPGMQEPHARERKA